MKFNPLRTQDTKEKNRKKCFRYRTHDSNETTEWNLVVCVRNILANQRNKREFESERDTNESVEWKKIRRMRTKLMIQPKENPESARGNTETI